MPSDNEWLIRRKWRCNDVPLTEYQKNVLCGTLLGDASLQFPSKACRVPIYTTTHSEKQKEYSILLADILGGKCKYRERLDKRTNKVYKAYDVSVPSNMYFLDLYSELYQDKIKQPTERFLSSFNEISLAFWFMDDGYSNDGTFFLCTDSFILETCNFLTKHIEEQLGLHFRVTRHEKNYRLRLRFDDRNKFVDMISPYLIDCVKYKIDIPIIFKPHRNNIRLTTEEFIKRAKEVHGDKYDYSKVEYTNNRTKVCIICSEHGEFWQRPSEHNYKKKSGCPECAKTKRILSRTINKRKKELCD